MSHIPWSAPRYPGRARTPTGVRIIARLARCPCDELRVAISLAPRADEDPDGAGHLVVDPATRGRYVGPFSPGDPEIVVYLARELSGRRVVCEVTALETGDVICRGRADVVLVANTIVDVPIALRDGVGQEAWNSLTP